MKKYLLSAALISASYIGFAQTTTTTSSTRKITINDKTVVKDSTGMVYPYIAWQKLMASGDFTLRPVDITAENPEFLILKLDEQGKYNRLANSPKPANSPFFTTGDAIKPFRIKDIDGQKVEAKDWAGKTVVLNFWFIDCPPCRAEIPDLNKLALKYKDNPNVIFIAVALDEGWQVKDFMKKNPLAYHLTGDGRNTANAFGIRSYPTNVVVDKQGKVMLHYTGGYQNGPFWMDKMIRQSEAGQAEQ